jgi:Cu/Ag efflux protein CusF
MKHLSKWFGALLVVMAVVVLATPALAAEAKGKIKSVSADKDTFVLESNGKDFTFAMGKDAKIKLNDKAGQLRDLKAGDEVSITYEQVGNRYVASEVRCTRKE